MLEIIGFILVFKCMSEHPVLVCLVVNREEA